MSLMTSYFPVEITRLGGTLHTQHAPGLLDRVSWTVLDQPPFFSRMLEVLCNVLADWADSVPGRVCRLYHLNSQEGKDDTLGGFEKLRAAWQGEVEDAVRLSY